MNDTQLETLVGKAGMYTDLMHMGAASLVYSPGCKGVALDELKRFADLVRVSALEDAAKACDKLTMALDHGGNEYRRESNASTCAKAIRALKATTQEDA